MREGKIPILDHVLKEREKMPLFFTQHMKQRLHKRFTHTTVSLLFFCHHTVQLCRWWQNFCELKISVSTKTKICTDSIHSKFALVWSQAVFLQLLSKGCAQTSRKYPKLTLKKISSMLAMLTFLLSTFSQKMLKICTKQTKHKQKMTK